MISPSKPYWRVSCRYGLGNQMFQYVFAKYLECKYGTEVALDVSWYGKDNSRTFDLGIIDDKIALKGKGWSKWAKVFNYNHLFCKLCHILTSEHFNNFFKLSQIVYEEHLDKFNLDKEKPYTFFRYFQRPDFAEYLRANNPQFYTNLKPHGEVPQGLKAVYDDITSSENALCLHIRKSDYTNPEWWMLNVCGVKYYERSLQYVLERQPNSKTFVFTDDPKWVEDNLTLPDTHILVPTIECNQFWYIWLMSKCRNFIISNSTFSWWGAYLCQNQQKLVVCPDKWINTENKHVKVYAHDLNSIKGWVKVSTAE